jgi:hypothetical protein
MIQKFFEIVQRAIHPEIASTGKLSTTGSTFMTGEAPVGTNTLRLHCRLTSYFLDVPAAT